MEGLYIWQVILFVLGVCLLLCEAASPGIGLFTVGGIGLLLCCFLPMLWRGSAPWYAFVPLIAGCVFMLLDSNTPGIGPLAVLGLLLLFSVLFLCEKRIGRIVLAVSLTAIISVPAVCMCIARLPSSKQMQRLALEEKLEGNGLPQGSALVGREAVALSDLRPGGLIRLDGKRFHAAAQEGFIEKDCPVKVVACRNGEMLVVRAPAGGGACDEA